MEGLGVERCVHVCACVKESLRNQEIVTGIACVTKCILIVVLCYRVMAVSYVGT